MIIERDDNLFGLKAAIMINQRLEQLLLGREIGIDRAFRHACRLHNVIHRGSIKALRHKALPRAIQNLLAFGGVEHLVWGSSSLGHEEISLRLNGSVLCIAVSRAIRKTE